MAAPVGNQNAKKAKIWAKAIERAIAKTESGDLDKGLDRLAAKLVNAADAGDQWALKEIGDRVDGKPVQAIEGTEDGPPVSIKGVIELVRPS